MYAVTIAENTKTLQLESAAFTDPGSRRDLNQDVVFHQTSQTRQGETIGLFMVCDGIGGHRGGEIASRIAVDTISGELAELFSTADLLAEGQQTRPSYLTLARKVEASVGRANEEIRRYAQNHANKTPDLGTTVTTTLIYDNVAHIASAGDSRTYLWREGEIKQITQDHSVAAQMAKEGIIEVAEIAHHPSSNVVLRALGADPEIDVDIFDCQLLPGDRLLLCSDGLWKAIADPVELAGWLGKPIAAADLCQQMVNYAKVCDGSDNISAVVVYIKEAGGC